MWSEAITGFLIILVITFNSLLFITRKKNYKPFARCKNILWILMTLTKFVLKNTTRPFCLTMLVQTTIQKVLFCIFISTELRGCDCCSAVDGCRKCCDSDRFMRFLCWGFLLLFLLHHRNNANYDCSQLCIMFYVHVDLLLNVIWINRHIAFIMFKLFFFFG